VVLPWSTWAIIQIFLKCSAIWVATSEGFLIYIMRGLWGASFVCKKQSIFGGARIDEIK
jgi:hypothetical protein